MRQLSNVPLQLLFLQLFLVFTTCASAVDLSKLRCSHQALVEDGNAMHRVYLFHNLVLWNGRILCISSDQAELPEIVVTWLHDKAKISMRSVSPSTLPFGTSPYQPEVEAIQDTMIAHFVNFNNYYHVFAETLPTWAYLMCKYRQLCKYDPHSDFRIFTVENRVPGSYDSIGTTTIGEVMACVVNKPAMNINHPELQNKVIVLESALVGLGPEIRAFHEWVPHYLDTWVPPPADVGLGWRQRLVSCLGVDFVNNKVERDKVKIVFVNRAYRTGRHINNIDELRQQTAATYPSAEVVVEYLEDTSLQHQIRLYMSASIVIYPHGASMANLVFMPQGSAGVEVVPWPGLTQHPHEWAESLRDDLGLNLKLFHVGELDRSLIAFMPEKLKEDPEYMALSAEQKVAWTERGQCPEGKQSRCDGIWDHHYITFVLPWTVLAPTLRDAWTSIHQRLPSRKNAAHTQAV